METLIQDLRQGVRRLIQHPGFTAVTVLLLSLGIGANTTIFSYLSAILLRPLPVREPVHVVALFTSDYDGSLYSGSSYPDYLDFEEKTDVFSGLMAYSVAPLGLTEGNSTDRVFGELVTANYFAVAGLEVARGRAFHPQKDDDAEPALVISDALWRRRFGADPAGVGRA